MKNEIYTTKNRLSLITFFKMPTLTKITFYATGPGTGQSPGHGIGHFYLKNIKIHSPGHGPSIDTGTSKSPGQGPCYFVRTVVSRSCPGTVKSRYRSNPGSVPFSVPGTEELLYIFTKIENLLKNRFFKKIKFFVFLSNRVGRDPYSQNLKFEKKKHFLSIFTVTFFAVTFFVKL